MPTKEQRPALEGWHTDGPKPQLLGSRCCGCGAYFFPKQTGFCKNPNCDSTEFDEVPLSRTGKVWSYTNACYKPPAPYVAAEPFEPFTIAAVRLEQEEMVVLGQVVKGVGVDDLSIGMPVELVLETLHEDEHTDTVTWKWQPVAG